MAFAKILYSCQESEILRDMITIPVVPFKKATVLRRDSVYPKEITTLLVTNSVINVQVTRQLTVGNFNGFFFFFMNEDIDI